MAHDLRAGWDAPRRPADLAGIEGELFERLARGSEPAARTAGSVPDTLLQNPRMVQ